MEKPHRSYLLFALLAVLGISNISSEIIHKRIVMKNVKESYEFFDIPVTKDNQHLIYPGAAFIISDDLVTGFPVLVPLPRSECSVNVSLPYYFVSRSMVPDYYSYENLRTSVLNEWLKNHDAKTLGDERNVMSKDYRDLKDLDEITAWTKFRRDLAKQITGDLTMAGVKTNDTRIGIFSMRNVFYTTGIDPYYYGPNYFNISAAKAMHYLNNADDLLGVVESIDYGLELFVVKYTDHNRPGINNLKVYGTVSEEDATDIYMNSDRQDAFESRLKRALSANKEKLGVPLSFRIKVYNKGQRLEGPLEFEIGNDQPDELGSLRN